MYTAPASSLQVNGPGILASKNGLIPQFFLRNRAVEPRYDTRADWEIISEKLETQGNSSLKPYSSLEKPPEGRFRLTFGGCALHTQGHTANNPVLSDQMQENRLWLNASVAERLGISDGDLVRVSQNGYSERIKASVTDMIHPEAVFVVHGFGHTLPLESRAFGRGLADNKFMKDGLECWDEAGGGLALQEHFVEIRKDKPLSSP